MDQVSPMTVAAWITRRIDELGKPQIEIAAECGWPKPNMVTMIKQGKTKVPLEKVGLLAQSLRVDAALLFWAVIAEYAPATYRAIDKSVSGVLLTETERELVSAYRRLAAHRKIADVRLFEDQILVDLQKKEALTGK